MSGHGVVGGSGMAWSRPWDPVQLPWAFTAGPRLQNHCFWGSIFALRPPRNSISAGDFFRLPGVTAIPLPASVPRSTNYSDPIIHHQFSATHYPLPISDYTLNLKSLR